MINDVSSEKSKLDTLETPLKITNKLIHSKRAR